MSQIVMIIDGNKNNASEIEQKIKANMPFQTIYSNNVDEALKRMHDAWQIQPNVVLLNISSTKNPQEAVQALRKLRKDIQILVLATYHQLEQMAEITQWGATDVLITPFHFTQLANAIRNALLRRDLQLEIRHAWACEQLSLDDINAQSDVLKATVYMAKNLADSETALVLEGAPGSGHEMLARAIHGSSARKGSYFISFNAALVSEDEAQERLFGDDQNKGVLEKVEYGTVLVRNIDALSPNIRKRFADILQLMHPVNEARPNIRFRGRVIFAMNDAVRRSSSKEKLEINHFFSMLNAMPLTLPYLREIPEDIPNLAMVYCQRYCAMEGKSINSISPAALHMLREISWPGNLEQLSQAIFNAVMCCQGNTLMPEDFRYLFSQDNDNVTPMRLQKNARPLKQSDANGVMRCVDETGNLRRLEDVEHEVIRFALERYSGHITDVARHLGIGRSTLYRKISGMDEK
ncbi:MAG: sigma 54-interacting transcriptional regulator [Alphaproteobacteria bacterium]|nr:sigma 54-interacting transcriptional regulator [Alphaproteobacteria bacterium]